jgi:hypothetical protein
MSTMITELYDALKEAGASEASARKAAETMANYENRFARIDAAPANIATKTDISDIRSEIADAKAEILKWMFGQTIIILGAVIALAKFAH